MKKFPFIFLLGMFVYACGGESSDSDGANSAPPESMVKKDEPADDGKGVGEIKDVKLNKPLIAEMVNRGKGIYEIKCAACHKLTDQRVVGPGWKGITDKRKPEWIMNMTLNIDVMLEEDPVARDLLKECLVRMPNQNLTEQEARDVLEFMYANDGQEVGG